MELNMELKRRADVPGGTGTRWLGNHNKRKFHDLDNEVTTCQIELMNPEHYRRFASREAAEDAGYDPCDWCVLGLGAEQDIEKV